MQCFEVGVRTVLGIACTVVVKRHDFISRCRHTAQCDRTAIAKLGGVGTIFVNVVTQMHRVLRTGTHSCVVGIEESS